MPPARRDLSAFRERFHGCLDRRADALFELCDAVLTAGNAPSPAHLSLAPAHRRGWGSLYAALRQGRIDAEALRDLLADRQLEDGRGRARVYAVDVSAWPRCDAETSPERGVLLPPQPPLGRPAHRRRMGLPTRGGVGLRARLVGRPG